MAAPKKHKSKKKTTMRRDIIYANTLADNWMPRRQWFYRRFYQLPFCPKSHVQHTFRFPGFWNGPFVGQVAEIFRKHAKRIP